MNDSPALYVYSRRTFALNGSIRAASSVDLWIGIKALKYLVDWREAGLNGTFRSRGECASRRMKGNDLAVQMPRRLGGRIYLGIRSGIAAALVQTVGAARSESMTSPVCARQSARLSATIVSH